MASSQMLQMPSIPGLSAQIATMNLRSPTKPVNNVPRQMITGGGDGPDEEEVSVLSVDKLNDEEHAHLKDLFEKTLTRKINIYSNEAIPLNNPWTFWVDRTERGSKIEQFEANLRCIYTVYTVQRFWSVYYNIPKPSDLQPRSSLHMMRDSRRPVWEEEYNSMGGTFRLKVQKKDSDQVWKELLMAAVGEQLTEFVHEQDEICGISVSTREKEDVLLIWNTNSELASESRILDCLRLILPDTDFLSTFYKPHVTHHAFARRACKKNAFKFAPYSGDQ